MRRRRGRQAAFALTVVVDVANVMGARADGWWRDRAGAALRLCREVTDLAGRGLSADRLPDGVLPPDVPGDLVLSPRWVLVLEGKARDAAALAEGASPLVRVVSAPGSGDDTIESAAAAWSADGSCLVVTADRELRRRCEAHGVSAAGPGWLLGLL